MYKSYNILFVISAITVTIFLTGCGHVYTRNEIIGTWVSNDGGRLEFSELGVQATRIPQYVLLDETFKPSKELCSGKGKWSIKDDIIDINFKPVIFSDGSAMESGYGTYMSMTGKGKSMKIFFTIGDPDSMDYYELKRLQN